MNGSRQQNAGSADEATQGGEAQRDLTWAEASVWTERMLSALGNGVKGGKWFSLMDKVFAPKTLAAAWTKVRANKGAAGVDGQSIERFAAKAEDYLAELSAALREGSYHPQAVKRVDIPKGDGRTRPLGIPTVKDRIVQQAVRLVIEPIFETRFRDGSYGFRPGRGCHDALREVDRLIKDGYAHVVDADLAGYFDSIPHDRLMAGRGEGQRWPRSRSDPRLADGRHPERVGEVDASKGLAARRGDQPAAGQHLPRPAGCGDGRTRALHGAVCGRLRHPVPDARGGGRRPRGGARLGERKRPRAAPRKDGCRRRRPGQGFEFLGYRFEAGQRHVRQKSLNKFKDSVREKTRRTRGDSLACVVADLNPLLRGWFGYFKHAHHTTFGKLDGFVRRRLRAILRKQEKRPGRGVCRADHQRWPNAFFAEAGLFALHTAWLSARQSR
jgi:RNA-directed DNA polymerase